MVTQKSNPNGAVQVLDFGAPKVITAYAMEVISGGALVYSSGTTNVVGSGLDSFVSTDIQVAGNASGANFLGMALKDVASGGEVPVAVDGVFIVKAIGSVFASQPVWTPGSGCVEVLGSLIVPASAPAGQAAARKIGRAITAAASGGFALIGTNAF